MSWICLHGQGILCSSRERPSSVVVHAAKVIRTSDRASRIRARRALAVCVWSSCRSLSVCRFTHYSSTTLHYIAHASLRARLPPIDPDFFMATLGRRAVPDLHGRRSPTRGDRRGGRSAAAAAESRRVQELVDAMRLELAVSHEVSVELVAANPLRASVSPVKGAAGTFRLSIEQLVSGAADAGRVEGRDRPRARPRVDLHPPPVSAHRAAGQSDRAEGGFRESLDSVYARCGRMLRRRGRCRGSRKRERRKPPSQLPGTSPRAPGLGASGQEPVESAQKQGRPTRASRTACSRSTARRGFST